MYYYSINVQPVLLGAPLQLGALSVRLVRLWVNPTLTVQEKDENRATTQVEQNDFKNKISQS